MRKRPAIVPPLDEVVLEAARTADSYFFRLPLDVIRWMLLPYLRQVRHPDHAVHDDSGQLLLVLPGLALQPYKNLGPLILLYQGARWTTESGHDARVFRLCDRTVMEVVPSNTGHAVYRPLFVNYQRQVYQLLGHGTRLYLRYRGQQVVQQRGYRIHISERLGYFDLVSNSFLTLPDCGPSAIVGAYDNPFTIVIALVDQLMYLDGRGNITHRISIKWTAGDTLFRDRWLARPHSGIFSSTITLIDLRTLQRHVIKGARKVSFDGNGQLLMKK